MNEHILQSYIDNITMHYGVSQEFIFSEGRKREKTEPRNLFFYLSRKKGIPMVTVQKFLLKKGYDLKQSNIYKTLKSLSKKIDNDKDYEPLIKKLEKITANV
jgi:chromosomal replication initiation ATPase DnaA